MAQTEREHLLVQPNLDETDIDDMAYSNFYEKSVEKFDRILEPFPSSPGDGRDDALGEWSILELVWSLLGLVWSLLELVWSLLPGYGANCIGTNIELAREIQSEFANEVVLHRPDPEKSVGSFRAPSRDPRLWKVLPTWRSIRRRAADHSPSRAPYRDNSDRTNGCGLRVLSPTSRGRPDVLPVRSPCTSTRSRPRYSVADRTGPSG